MPKKIAMIIPFFGQWPQWMDLYLYSCSMNQIMDIYLFSDIPLTNGNISNVKYNYTTFTDYCHRISETLNIQFCPDNPRKLCDVKPFYGFIHQNELQGYDFWGTSDIDVLYGNLSCFINDKLLDNYDFISTHSDRVSGHFFLARNCKKMVEMPFQIKKWEKMLTENKNWIVDEAQLLDVLLPHFRKIQYLYNLIYKLPLKSKRQNIALYNKIADLFRFFWVFQRKRLYFKEFYSTPYRTKYNGFSMKYLYSDGKITDLDVGKEIMYLHFLGYKNNLWKDSNAYLKIDT
jgi:hypothetical protein